MILSAHDTQDIARSSYADMLNDDERNRAYDSAIKICVKSLVTSYKHNPDKKRFFNCCDIGCGSGLLSMMIVRAFRELNYELFHVTAYEAFQPMAECAEKVVQSNQMSKYITIVPKRLEDNLEPTSALYDLLVAELLDTELIGEGCLDVYRHAIEYLCSPNCLFIPYEARIYIEPVASKLLYDRYCLSNNINIDLSGEICVQVHVPKNIEECCGLSAIDDMQVSQLKHNEDFTRFTSPQVAFNFTFSNAETLVLRNHKELRFQIEKTPEQPLVAIMWWDILMYNRDAVDLVVMNNLSDLDKCFYTLSCAPTWARSPELLSRDKTICSTYKREVWREHWIQGIYYFHDYQRNKFNLPNSTESGNMSHITVHAYHDSHSLWFSLDKIDDKLPPSCTCDVHRALTRAQIASLNDYEFMNRLLRSYLRNLSELPIRGFFEPHHSIGWQITFEFNHPNKKAILSNPSIQIHRPWKVILSKLHGPSQEFENDLFESLTIKFTQVKFYNLSRIRSRVRECEGFIMNDLDDLITHSSKQVDESLEFHYLWEYDCERIDDDHVLYSSESSTLEEVEQIKTNSYGKLFELPIKISRPLREWKDGWALVFWIELKMKHTNEILSTGPNEDCKLFQKFTRWNRHFTQAIHFMHDYPTSQENEPVTQVDVVIFLKNNDIVIEREVE